MYYYVGFKIGKNVNVKYFYNGSIIVSENYLFRQQDNVKDKIIEKIKPEEDIKLDGYLIFDELGIKQIEYLNKLLAWEYVDEINTSIIQRLAKQTILFE
jgi:hypothetical protein